MKVVFYREVKNMWRYYRVSIQKNLFKQYALEIQFGSCATNGSHYKYYSFDTLLEAHIFLRKLIKQKLKKGYRSKLLVTNTKIDNGGYKSVAA